MGTTLCKRTPTTRNPLVKAIGRDAEADVVGTPDNNSISPPLECELCHCLLATACGNQHHEVGHTTVDACNCAAKTHNETRFTTRDSAQEQSPQSASRRLAEKDFIHTKYESNISVFAYLNVKVAAAFTERLYTQFKVTQTKQPAVAASRKSKQQQQGPNRVETNPPAYTLAKPINTR